MPPSVDARFAGLPTLSVTAPDGSTRHVLAIRWRRPPLPRAGSHRVLQGEGLDLIARRAFGDEHLWWRILDGNPVRYPFDLEPGEVLDLVTPGMATATSRARSF